MTVLLTRNVVETLIPWMTTQFQAENARYLADAPQAAPLPNFDKILDAEPQGLPDNINPPSLILLASDLVAQIDEPGYFEAGHVLTLELINAGIDEHALQMSLYDYVAIIVRTVMRTRNGQVALPAGITNLLLGGVATSNVASYGTAFTTPENKFFGAALVRLAVITGEPL